MVVEIFAEVEEVGDLIVVAVVNVGLVVDDGATVVLDSRIKKVFIELIHIGFHCKYL